MEIIIGSLHLIPHTQNSWVEIQACFGVFDSVHLTTPKKKEKTNPSTQLEPTNAILAWEKSSMQQQEAALLLGTRTNFRNWKTLGNTVVSIHPQKP